MYSIAPRKALSPTERREAWPWLLPASSWAPKCSIQKLPLNLWVPKAPLSDCLLYTPGPAQTGALVLILGPVDHWSVAGAGSYGDGAVVWCPGLRRLLDCHCTVVATSKKNACVSLVFSFLYKVVQVRPQWWDFSPGEGFGDCNSVYPGILGQEASVSLLIGESLWPSLIASPPWR